MDDLSSAAPLPPGHTRTPPPVGHAPIAKNATPPPARGPASAGSCHASVASMTEVKPPPEKPGVPPPTMRQRREGVAIHAVIRVPVAAIKNNEEEQKSDGASPACNPSTPSSAAAPDGAAALLVDIAQLPDHDAIRERNVYVAELPVTFTDDHFASLMAEFGTVASFRLFNNTRRVRNSGRAYAFCLFQAADDAAAAVAGLDGLVVEGRAIEVRLSNNGVVQAPPPKASKSSPQQPPAPSSAPPKKTLPPKRRPSRHERLSYDDHHNAQQQQQRLGDAGYNAPAARPEYTAQPLFIAPPPGRAVDFSMPPEPHHPPHVGLPPRPMLAAYPGAYIVAPADHDRHAHYQWPPQHQPPVFLHHHQHHHHAHPPTGYPPPPPPPPPLEYTLPLSRPTAGPLPSRTPASGTGQQQPQHCLEHPVVVGPFPLPSAAPAHQQP